MSRRSSSAYSRSAASACASSLARKATTCSTTRISWATAGRGATAPRPAPASARRWRESRTSCPRGRCSLRCGWRFERGLSLRLEPCRRDESPAHRTASWSMQASARVLRFSGPLGITPTVSTRAQRACPRAGAAGWCRPWARAPAGFGAGALKSPPGDRQIHRGTGEGYGIHSRAGAAAGR